MYTVKGWKVFAKSPISGLNPQTNQLKLMNHNKQYGVTPHFSTGQILLKKSWENIDIGKNYWKNIENR